MWREPDRLDRQTWSLGQFVSGVLGLGGIPGRVEGGDIAIFKMSPQMAIFSNSGAVSTPVPFPYVLLTVLQQKELGLKTTLDVSTTTSIIDFWF